MGFLLGLCLQTADQQPAADAQGLQHGLCRFIMLPGQNLGRGHHCRLIPSLADHGNRAEGQCRFSAAHVALHQTAHGARAAQIISDFLKHAPLRTGRRKGHCPPEGLRGVLRQRDGHAILLVAAHQPQRSLIHQHLLEGQTAARPPEVLQVCREMRLTKRKIKLTQAMPQPECIGQRLRAAVVHLLQRLLHHRAEGLGRDALHRPVHRLDGRLRHPLRILHHRSVPADADAPKKHDALPHRQLLCHPWLVVPGQRQLAAAIRQRCRYAGNAMKPADLRGLRHHAHDQRLAAPCLAAGGDLRAILVAKGQRVKQIAQ